jgi:hypothetical protein
VVIKVKFDIKHKKAHSKILMWTAAVAVLFSFVGWISHDIWLASTQWLLVAAVLALFGIYLRLS